MIELIEYRVNLNSIRKCRYVSMMFERPVGEGEPALPFKQARITEQKPILQDNLKLHEKKVLILTGICIVLAKQTPLTCLFSKRHGKSFSLVLQ